MDKLVVINQKEDIFETYRNTPIGDLLEYQNLNRPFELHESAKLLVGMCMDNRKHLTIPENFAYIIRAGGANLRYSEFKVSYAISVGGVGHIALIGHNNCGMVNLSARKDQFIDGLVAKAGWNRDTAEQHFNHFEPMFEIANEVDFICSEAKRLRMRYPKILIAPMMYNVDDNKLALIREE
ncbi:MAG: carbonic anhydrase [Salinivirgaceae bacterium]